MMGVFLLSGEANIYQILGLSITPIFGISTIQILGAAFFVILFTKGKPRDKKRAIPALVIALLYFLCAGKAHLIPGVLQPFLVGLMILLSVIGMVQTLMESSQKRAFAGKALAISLICWGLFTVILSFPAIISLPGVARYIGDGFLSSVLSFGGGDAYLSVAQGMFVDSGMISYQDFYGSIVSVANALPGSILCKILSGCGYVMGFQQNGSVVMGLFMAVCGFACSVAASGAIVIVVRMIYDKYENLRIFAVVKHFIRPIISGLLLNVALSLYLSGILEIAGGSLTMTILSVITLIIIALVFVLEQKKDIHLLWKILLSAAISFVGCNLFAAI